MLYCMFQQDSTSVISVLMRRGAVLLKHGQPAHVWQCPLSKEVVVTVCLLHFDTISEHCYISST